MPLRLQALPSTKSDLPWERAHVRRPVDDAQTTLITHCAELKQALMASPLGTS